MKLTKLQRYTAYVIMLAEFETYLNDKKGRNCHDGFCWAFYHTFNLYDVCKHYTDSIELFPELLSRKPKDNNWLWFEANCRSNDGIRSRISILKKCINETHP